MAEFFKRISFKQDLPPPGGYAPVAYERNLPKRGPSGYVLFGGCAAVMLVGFYRIVLANRKYRAIKRETINARIALLPLLQAEADRETLRALMHNVEEEAKIMKDVKGWKVGESVYNADRWVPPHQVQLEKL